MIAKLLGWLGANLKAEPRYLADEVGVNSVNQKPDGDGVFKPWRTPLAISPAPVVPAGRVSLYRMGRDTPTALNFWLSWSTFVHIARGFETEDPTERTYFTGAIGGPQWTDNAFGLASAPYPGATRLLAVPQPTIAPTASLVTDGPSGDARRLYYCFTWVNDIGWESAPSPPVLAPLAKPGAILNLSTTETVPAGAYGVTALRWYRTQTTSTAGEAEFFFLREYAIGASGMQDDARDLGATVLPTEVNTLRLPLDVSATWLTDCWNEFAAALVGRSVRFCEPNLIYAWPLGNEYTISDTPIAQAAFARQLLVLTTAGAELFFGDQPDAMNRKPLQLAACVAPRSVVTGDYWCAWAAADGMWLYQSDGSVRNLVANIMTPKQWLALVPTSMHCYQLDLGSKPLIIGFYNDGASKGFVIDPANNNGIYFLAQGYSTAYWDKLLRKLFVLVGANALSEWDAGAAFMTATYRSKVYRQQAHTEAEWFELLSSGDVTAKVFTGDTDTPDAVLQEDMNRVVTSGQHRLPDGTQGRDYQVEVSTQGAVKAALIE